MSIIKELFSEKFRPKELGQLIAPPRVKNELKNGLVQNVLLYGTQGTGKCVDENTIVKLRNKKTGEIIETSIKDFMGILGQEK